MSMFITLCASSALLLVLLYRHVIYPAVLSPLAKIPNAHFSCPISGAWISQQRRQSREIKTIYAAHQKHGPIVRLGPNEISVASLDGLRQIYLGGYDKDRWYVDEFINYGTPNLVSMMQYKPHSVQKRMLSHVYSKSFLHNCQNLRILSEVIVYERFLPLLRDAAEKEEDINVLELNASAGMDLMSAYLFGLANGTDFIRDAPARRTYFNLHHEKIHGSHKDPTAKVEIEKYCMALCEAAEKQLQSSIPEKEASFRTTEPVVYSALSSRLKNSKESPHEHSVIPQAVASEMLDQLMAGHETSGITLTYILYELSKNQMLQERLREELLTLSPTITISKIKNFHRLPSAQAIDSLPLLNAILRETLRLYAAAPAPQPRRTPPNASIEGISSIPAGVRVSTSAYVMHRNPEVYPDPLAWKPERWLGKTSSKIENGSAEKEGTANGYAEDPGLEEMRRWFWAFGSGGRMCVGSNFAIQILKLLTASIYTNFSTSIIDDEGIEQADSYISGPKSNKLILRFHVLEPRTPMSSPPASPTRSMRSPCH